MSRALPLNELVVALREALASSEDDAARFFTDNLTGAPFGRQRPLEYYQPPRGGTERTAALTSNPEVRRRMMQYIEDGIEQGADRWYDTNPIRAAFVNELGPDEGPASFRRFMEFNGALSPKSRVPDQLRRASLFYSAERQGEPLPILWQPKGYGHYSHATAHRALLEQLLESGRLPPETASKTASFIENLSGNQAPTTVDSHAVALPAIISGDPRWLKGASGAVEREGEKFVPRRAFEAGEIDIDDALEHPSWWGGRPLKTEYKALADFYSDLGREVDLTGARAQSAAWVGGGDVTGVQSGPDPFSAHFARQVRDTAEKRGVPFQDALRDVVRGSAPFAGLLLALRALLASREDPAGQGARI